MVKNLHTDPFDDLLRSKYETEQITPPKELWKNIRSSLGKGVSHVSVWTKSRYLLWSALGTGIIVAIAIAFFTLPVSKEKTAVLSPEKKVEIKNEKRFNKSNKERKIVTFSHRNRAKQPALIRNTPVQTGREQIPDNQNRQLTSGNTSISSVRHTSNIGAGQPMNSEKSIFYLPALHSLNPRALSQHPFQQYKASSSLLQTKDFATQKVPAFGKMKNKKGTLQTNNLLTNNKRLCIKLFINPEFSSRFLSNNPAYSHSEFNKAYFDKRDQYSFTYSYGFTASYRLKPPIRITTGVVWAPYSIRFSTERVPVVGNHQNIESLIYTSSGIVKVAIHSSDSIANNTILNSTINLYYLRVPLGINYRFSKHFSIGTRLFFELFVNHDLNWKAENYHGEMDVSTEEIKDINAFTMGMAIDAEYEKSIYRNLYFSFSPNFSLHILSINNKNTVKSYPFTLGLQFGIKYYLF